jgi:hypothetical protein
MIRRADHFSGLAIPPNGRRSSADPQLTAVLLQFVGPDLDGFI